MFCSWGAEEYGLIGSYEWVEQHAKVLSQRAVAYLNVDIAVEGIISYIVDVDIIAGATILYLVLTSIFFVVFLMSFCDRKGNYSLWGSGAPLMNKVYLESSKKIANPNTAEVNEGRPTVFDTWVHRYPDANHPNKPRSFLFCFVFA